MTTLLLSLILSADPLATGAAWHPFALDTATVDDACRLEGRTVRSTFRVVNRPDYPLSAQTVCTPNPLATVCSSRGRNSGQPFAFGLVA